MPRLFFTGRRKLAQEQISLTYRPGCPPEFSASIDLTRNQRKLPADAKVVVEAYHNTALQRFDFGTVADCRPREPLRLTAFDESDRPQFRVRVVDVSKNIGVLLASCDRVAAVDPDEPETGGRSLLKLFPRPNDEMHGELWRIEQLGGYYQVAYNKDMPSLQRLIKSRDPMVLGLIMPSALREILAREMLWERISTDERTDWLVCAQSILGEPPPQGDASEPPSREAVEDWIERSVQAFCRDRGLFVERATEVQGDEARS